MRRCLRTATTVLIAAGLLASCSSTKTKSSPPTVVSTTSTTTVPASTTVASVGVGPVPGSDAELAARLVTAVPAGFELQPDSVGDTGPSDLAKAVKDDGAPDAEQVLRSEGFVRGYQRLWAGPSGSQIIVFIYQFGTQTGANQDFQRAKSQLAGEAPPQAAAFTVDGLPADASAAIAGTSADGSAAIVLFTTGVFNVQVVGNATALDGLQERVSPIAKDQYSRL